MFPQRWIEIDTDALRHNLKSVDQHKRSTTMLMVVVKADGYGLGAVETARVAAEAGAQWLGVTTVEEGLELRRHRLQLPILVFAPVLPQELEPAEAAQLTLTVGGLDQASWMAAAAEANKLKLKIHLKIETGMGRTGLLPGEAPVAMDLLQQSGALVGGVYTHFSAAAQDAAWTRMQFERLQAALQELPSAPQLIQHCCNSAATLLFPEMHLDLVRVGTLVYGQHPPHTGTLLSLRDPWAARARVLHLREVPQGTSIGYGRDFLTRRTTRVAVVPLGYADGFALSPVTRPKSLLDLARMLGRVVRNYWLAPDLLVRWQGRTAPVIGRVGMQLAMVDVTGLPGIQVGDIVDFPLRRTMASPMMPRAYVRDGRIYCWRKAINEVFELDTMS